jgi:hypothetical protein
VTIYPKDLPTRGWTTIGRGEAFPIHEFLPQPWSDPGSRQAHLVPRLGYGHGMLQRFTWDARRISVTNEPHIDLQLDDWDDLGGDGTVSSFSAIRDEEQHADGIS